MKKKVEILAPAGSYDSFLAAIHAGSDAVYLGGTQFSARAFADNFTQKQLLQALDYAHLHGRKIYMTVNTLLKEEELQQLPEYLLPYYCQGLDAVIVQDVGVLEIVAKYFPDMAVHLSTQMTLTNGMGAKLLEYPDFLSYPVTRMVPARELSLEELKILRKETKLELEVFVHGALCICYSGQCFLSSMIGGRSGNRGRCAQPCRKPYSSLDGYKSYILSPKDLCTLEMIPDLIEAGIDSFKIEGRMKKPEYTAYISWLYRKYADRFLHYGRKEYEAYFQKHPQELEDDLRGMKDLYNRGGFTKGYFINHNSRNMMSMERPNHEGVLVGTVENVNGNKAEIFWKQEIFLQDILEIRNQGEKIYEYTSGFAQKPGEKSQIRFYAKAKVKRGMRVYRTRNNQLLSWIDETLIKHPCKKKLHGYFKAIVGTAVSLTIWTEESDECINVTNDICQKAKTHPITKEEIKRQLFRLGDTEFLWETLEIQISDDVFLPIKSINELRRQALEEFQKKYIDKFQRKIAKGKRKIEKNFDSKKNQTINIVEKAKENNIAIEKISIKGKMQKLPIIAAEVLTVDQWKAAIDLEKVYIIYVRMEILEEEKMISFAEETKRKGKKCFLSMPRILHKPKRKLLEKLFIDLINKQFCDGILVHNMEELGFITEFLKSKEMEKGQKIELIADFSMYSTNHMAIKFWKKHGCSRITASIEQNFHELLNLFSSENIINHVDTEIQIYGRIPLMVSAQCITSYAKKKECIQSNAYTVLTDEQKRTLYAMNFCRFCYNILYSKPCDLRWQTELLQIPFSVWRCSFTTETEQETKDILKSVEIILEGKDLPKPSGVWTGHFHKGMI